MILIVGAQASGKSTFAKTLADEDDIIFDAQELLPRKEGVAASYALLEELRAKRVVTVAEVGCGVHPLDREERDWRDAVGRMQSKLAAQATCVVRMCCGIPQVIKGELCN